MGRVGGQLRLQVGQLIGAQQALRRQQPFAGVQEADVVIVRVGLAATVDLVDQVCLKIVPRKMPVLTQPRNDGEDAGLPGLGEDRGVIRARHTLKHISRCAPAHAGTR